MFKIKRGLVPNPGLHWNTRLEPDQLDGDQDTTGKMGDTPSSASGLVCNTLPVHLRGLEDREEEGKTILETFKEDLDKYLRTIPDDPGTQANSLLNIQIPRTI
jgi:hypothetical protein